MDDVTVRRRLMSLLVLTAATLLVWLWPGAVPVALSPYFTAQYLAVGQGDATFITTPDGGQILIDGGPNTSVLRELAAVMPAGDRTIDVVVATHADRDHIGGLIDVLERYEVGTIVRTENEGGSPAAATYEKLVTAEGAEIVLARRGQSLTVGASTTLTVLWPETDPTTLETNAASIVFMVTYGDTHFLFTGDAPKRIEEYLVLAEGEHLKANVLQVGHHGSRTSTAELFLAEVQPEFAVLSYGATNPYGHPHVEVTDALFNAGVSALSTAEQGTITLLSDGARVWRE